MPKNYISSFYWAVRKNGWKTATKKTAMKLASVLGIKLNVPKQIHILLLTNRDSDNTGDQVIEACDIALIQAVMENLNISRDRYEIKSRAAGIISKEYLKTHNPELLDDAVKAITESDVLIFGGAPLFNYKYQIFYERTAVTLELAQKYNVPVIFSAIGVEEYDENDPKCLRLRNTLNFECVKQLTTRDDLDSLLKFVEDQSRVLGRVSDPAVFTAEVFRNYISTTKKNKKKKIGIFILRAGGFKSNRINFSYKDMENLWVGIIKELIKKDYDYTLLTSGHFGDEAFLERLINDCHIDRTKCETNINTPEQLIEAVSSFDGIISTRLHPSIIAYSLKVPAVGLVWNQKVRYFYETIGYPERALCLEEFIPEVIVHRLEQAMDQGVSKDPEYLMSVYRTLYSGLGSILTTDTELKEPFNYDKLSQNLPTYPGTSPEEKDKKISGKFKRTYQKYNELLEKNKK